MQATENNYAFRRKLAEVHKPDRRAADCVPGDGETVIDEEWSIVYYGKRNGLLERTAKDLQDYLFVSMNISVKIRRVDSLEAAVAAGRRTIALGTAEQLPDVGGHLTVKHSYRVTATADAIVVCGRDERGAAQGSYYLEDIMNLREAPFVPLMDTVRAPLFSPRMAHSGWGIDQFPDAHLNEMAHAGIDAIVVFVKGIDHTAAGFQDINHLIDRAEQHGLDVYMYSYVANQESCKTIQPHPDDPGAAAFYDKLYGSIFAVYPRLKGVILVGESVEFMSKDPHTTGLPRLEWPEEHIRTKPNPGWWPCEDYPQWVSMVRDAVRKHRSDADIVFWTYNWGWAPEEARIKLIRVLPQDITLLVTFEMFEQIKRDGVTNVCVDYTAAFEGPGAYFASEAEAARERGLKLYAMSNTGGMTWDFGVIPYEPVPYQWARRHEALLRSAANWELSGLLENHHYGWWPSFVSDLTKWRFWTPSPDRESLFESVARRDFGAAAAPFALAAWQHWSEAIRDYIPTPEDQYGPFRIGPSYPFVFNQVVAPPASKHAYFGNLILMPDYKPYEDPRQSPGPSRVPVEIRYLEKMKSRWEEGNASLIEALKLTPENKRAEGERLLLLNEFIVRMTQTAIHAKRWWLAKIRLQAAFDPAEAGGILDELKRLGELEIANAEAAIPLVAADSRLGWEPSMEYMTDPARVRWKIAQLRAVLDYEIPQYRRSLEVTAGYHNHCLASCSASKHGVENGSGRLPRDA